MEDNRTQIINLSAEQLRSRREAILALLGLTHKEFVRKSMNDGLEGEEWKYASELDAIDFLLGEDEVTNE